MKTKENGENIYKMLNAWLKNFRSILAFMKKKIKDTERERPEGKRLGNSWTVFNSIFMNNKGPSHTLKGRTFFFITFAKKFIIQITWNLILYHWHASSAMNYGKLLLLFFFKIFPVISRMSTWEIKEQVLPKKLFSLNNFLVSVRIA